MHEGHRQRMFERLEENSKLQDHELLEILLFYVLPRVNTNETAHALLDSFGDLHSIFEADIKKLEAVKGIGPTAARYLFTIGKVMKKVERSHPDDLPYAYSYESFAMFLHARLRNASCEMLELYVVKKTGELAFCRRFSSEDENKVEVPVSEIVSFVANFNPKEVIVVHNHVYGWSSPSAEDDYFTKKLYLYLDLSGVRLIDHYIISPRGVYSYQHEGRMEDIRKTCSASSVLKNL